MRDKGMDGRAVGQVHETKARVVQVAPKVVMPFTPVAPPHVVVADSRIAYLIQLWSEMLNTTVTENDDFFDLGDTRWWPCRWPTAWRETSAHVCACLHWQRRH